MKKSSKVLVAALVLANLLPVIGACNPNGGGGGEQIDETKTQLYVYNFAGGFGTEWIASAKQRFEKLHENDTNWEEGKKGVQVIVTNKKDAPVTQMDTMLKNREEIYFSESVYYYEFKAANLLYDITDVVTTNLSDLDATDSRTIEGKLTKAQKDYLGVKEADNKTHYYGVPHYMANVGIAYNIDVFERQGYYFADLEKSSGGVAGRFIDKNSTNEGRKTKSAGLDGLYGTFDDGLPRTYQDFYDLCTYIAQKNEIPFVWAGEHGQYPRILGTQLAYDYEGLDQAILNYTLDGTATNLGKVVDGEFVLDANDTVIDEETKQNGWEMSRQAGKFYALQFLEKIVKQADAETGAWSNEFAFNSAYKMTDAQKDFIYSPTNASPDVAMLIDGSWWEMEADAAFDTLADKVSQEYSRQNSNYGWMPLPKATEAKAKEVADAFAADVQEAGGLDKYVYGSGDAKLQTTTDYLSALCYMKANVADWKVPLAKEFIRFCNTDESLSEFTTITSTLKALDYNVKDTSKLTNYAKNLVALKQVSDIVYPYANSNLFVNNQSSFSEMGLWFSRFSDYDYWAPAQSMHSKNITAAEYFTNMEVYYKATWNSMLR